MNMDEMENGLRVRHVTFGRNGTIRLLVDTVELRLDNGEEFEVSPLGVVRPEDLEVIGEAAP